MKIRRLFNVLCIISFRFLLRTIRNRFRVETCHVTNPEVLKMRMNMICLNVGDYDTIALRFCLKMSKFEGKLRISNGKTDVLDLEYYQSFIHL